MLKSQSPFAVTGSFLSYIPLPGVRNVNTYWHAFILLSDAMKLVCKECSLVSTPVGFITDRRMIQCASRGALPGTVWRHMQCQTFQTELELFCGFKCNHLNLLDTWMVFVCQTLSCLHFSWSVYFLWGIYNVGFVCSPQSLLSYWKSILVGKRKKLCLLAEK